MRSRRGVWIALIFSRNVTRDILVRQLQTISRKTLFQANLKLIADSFADPQVKNKRNSDVTNGNQKFYSID